MTSYEKAKAYKTTLPTWLHHATGMLSNLYSAYGSGYFFYCLLTVGVSTSSIFPYWDVVFWFALVIGLLVQSVLWDVGVIDGRTSMRCYLNSSDVKEDNFKEKFLYKVSQFAINLSWVKLFSRATTQAGMAIILFAQISMIQNQISVSNNLADNTGVSLSEAKEKLQKLENTDIEKTKRFLDILQDKNDGDKYNDARADARMDSLIVAHREDIKYWRNKVATLEEKNEDRQLATVKLDITAVFRFIAENERAAILLLLIATLMAVFVLDTRCYSYGFQTGEKRECQGLINCIEEKYDLSDNESSSSSGVDWSNPKNQKILEDLEKWYGKFSPRLNKKVAFEDIANDYDCSRQYIARLHQVAKEDGLI